MGKKRLLVGNLLVFFLVVCSLSISASSVSAGKGQTGDACLKTAYAALKACRADERSNYWNAIGNCNNLADKAEIRECKQETRTELQDLSGECLDQYEARQDICEVLGGSAYQPEIDPDNFVGYVDNPYMPLVPGTVSIYVGDDERIEVRVTYDTKEIAGVECIVVRDTVWTDGELVEDTYDWFAQDVEGNVWYFGELSQEFEEGELVSLDGSWKTGVDGAAPGIVMPVDLWTGKTYRQEFLLNEAEDMAKIIDIGQTVSTRYGTFSTLVTEDWTPLEPDVVEHKFYAPGIGFILEIKPETGEKVELIETRFE